MKNLFVALVASLSASSVYAADLAVDQTENKSPTYSFYGSLFAGAGLDATLDQVWNPTFHEEYYLDTGWLVGATFGVRLWDWTRVEGELSYQDFGPDANAGFLDGVQIYNVPDPIDHSVSVTYLMANLWADIPNNTAFTPYVGGGIGAAWVNYQGLWSGNGGLVPSEADTAFAWQLGGGIQYDFTSEWSVDVGYRYKRLEDFHITSDVSTTDMEGTLDSHNVQLGIVRRF